jgi:outer membrane lipoprotein-sorting protein
VTQLSRASTRRRSLRRVAALTAAPLLVVVLAACGGGDSSDAGDEATTAPASEATEGETPEATPEEEATEDSGGSAAQGEEVDKEEFLSDVQAAVEDATTAHMTMSTGSGGMSIEAEGEVDYTTSPPSMAMTMTNPAGGTTPMDVRLVDGFFYMNMGQMSQNKFYKISLDDPNSPLGDMSQFAATMDPVQAFEQFAAGLETVEYVGEEEVEGEQLHHYVLTLDTTKIEMLEQTGAQGLPKQLDYDLWLDDEDRMRQVQLDVGETASVDMRVFDWDEPVDIKAPPASDVAPMPQN